MLVGKIWQRRKTDDEVRVVGRGNGTWNTPIRNYIVQEHKQFISASEQEEEEIVYIGMDTGQYVGKLMKTCACSVKTSIFSTKSTAETVDWKGDIRDLWKKKMKVNETIIKDYETLYVRQGNYKMWTELL